MYLPFINLFKPGDPVRNVANVEDHNRVANILNDLKGIGCRIQKPVNGEGRGWTIIVDGTSDIDPPDNIQIVTSYTNNPPPGQANGKYGGIMSFCAESDSGAYDVLLDDTIDWRHRIVRSSMATSGPSSATPADNLKYVGAAGSAVNLVTDGTYQVYVDTNGDLRVSASAASDAVVITLVVGGRSCVCPEASRSLDVDVTLDGTFTLELKNTGCYGGGNAPTSHTHAFSGTYNFEWTAVCPNTTGAEIDAADLGNGWRAAVGLTYSEADGWAVSLAIVNYDALGAITNGGSTPIAAWVRAGFHVGATPYDVAGDYGTLSRITSACNGAGTTADGTIGVDVANA